MKMYYLILILAIFSCERNSTVYSIIDVKNYADSVRLSNKKIALLLTKERCKACEIMLREWNDYYANLDLQVLPINTDLKENKLFNKLSQNYVFPVVIVIDYSLMVRGIIAGVNNKKNIATLLKNSINGKFASNFCNGLNLGDEQYQRVLTTMFRVQYFFEHCMFDKSLSMLRELNQEEPFFYSLYLQAVVEQKIGEDVAAKETASKALLFVNPLFESIYRENIREMQKIAQHITDNFLSKDSILCSDISSLYIYELGTMSKGRKKTFTIKFRNNDTLPISIVDITSSCICIDSKWVKKPIYSGEVSKVTIEYTPQYEGDFSNILMLKIVNAHRNEKGIPILVRGCIGY